MQNWNFEIFHRLGIHHHVPDTLSRMFEENSVEISAFETISNSLYIKKRVENNRLYRHRSDSISTPFPSLEDGCKLVAPVQYRERVFRDADSELLAFHLRIEKIYNRVVREYYWQGIWFDVHNFVREGPEYQLHKVLQEDIMDLMDCITFFPSKSQCNPKTCFLVGFRLSIRDQHMASL